MNANPIFRPSRREFLKQTAAAGLAAALPGSFIATANPTGDIKACLSPGAIGVKASGHELIAFARKHGFDAVEPSADFLMKLSDAEWSELREKMNPVVWGAAGLPVDFRGDDDKFRSGLEALPAKAKALQRAGVDRVGTWLSPSHGSLSYADNFKRHAARLREVAKVLRDHGQRLGLEYVGTPSLRAGRPHSFIYSMRQTRDLIAEIGTGNVGYVLDTWHWWTAGEAASDIAGLKPVDVISVDLNDAPPGIPLEKQQDGQRELPAATGVIPAKEFISALRKIGYTGPARAEPFNRKLNEMEDVAACAAVIASIRKLLG